MTDALITGLAQLGSIKVISRTSIMRYKKTDKSLPEGTVQRSGDRVRITARLIEGSTDRHIWANSYERDLREAVRRTMAMWVWEREGKRMASL